MKAFNVNHKQSIQHPLLNPIEGPLDGQITVHPCTSVFTAHTDLLQIIPNGDLIGIGAQIQYYYFKGNAYKDRV